MDWQTKEYIDEKFDEILDQLSLISEKLGVDNLSDDQDDLLDKGNEDDIDDDLI